MAFHWRRSSHLSNTSYVISQSRIGVKLNRVFFPRWLTQTPFTSLWFRWIEERSNGNLVNPLMRVANYMTRHLATSRESQLLPPFTRACLNFITLTFRALGRNHIVSTPLKASASDSLVRSSSESNVHRTERASRSMPCPSIVTKRESTRHREALSSFRAAQILRQAPLNPTLRELAGDRVVELRVVDELHGGSKPCT